MRLRIKWLDIELTEAILIRGRLWWRQMAHVRRRTLDERARCKYPEVSWVFTYSEVPAMAANNLLEFERDRQLAHGIDDVDWVKARDQRPAKKLKSAKMRLLP
jgi:hypothetical protein